MFQDYIFFIGVFAVAVVIFTIPALIVMHKNNTKNISLQRMHNRELAEALVGKKIDWDN